MKGEVGGAREELGAKAWGMEGTAGGVGGAGAEGGREKGVWVAGGEVAAGGEVGGMEVAGQGEGGAMGDVAAGGEVLEAVQHRELCCESSNIHHPNRHCFH